MNVKQKETIASQYGKLMEKSKEITLLQTVQSIAHWDMETKMPPGGIELRSQQLAVLSQIIHKMATNPQIGTLLSKIEKHPDFETLTEFKKRNLYLLRKQYEEQTKLPEQLVVETAKQRALTVDVWKKAKAAKDYSKFKPELMKLTELRKQAAEILMKVKATKTPYDALIDVFEPRMTSREISKIFEELRGGLVILVKKCVNAPNQPDTSFLTRQVPIDIQRRIASELAKFMEYDVDSPKAIGRIDETEHPFTTGYYDDVRITTHYYENNFTSSIFSVLHEAGHAMYDLNLNKDWIYQPIGSGCSYGFHESQSRFVENIIGRSSSFWTFFLPKLKQLTGNTFSDIALEDFVRAINKVKPSKIRIEADEVTYCLHIIIRFEIERELMHEKIEIPDLPAIWNEKYKEYLNVDIENDSEGVMQDTHWAAGLFGYFPSYALGNIYSSQILEVLDKNLPNWKNQIANGNFHDVKNWLAEKVHTHGDLYDPQILIKKITGNKIEVKPFLRYLNRKFSLIH